MPAEAILDTEVGQVLAVISTVCQVKRRGLTCWHKAHGTKHRREMVRRDPPNIELLMSPLYNTSPVPKSLLPIFLDPAPLRSSSAASTTSTSRTRTRAAPPQPWTLDGNPQADPKSPWLIRGTMVPLRVASRPLGPRRPDPTDIVPNVPLTSSISMTGSSPPGPKGPFSPATTHRSPSTRWDGMGCNADQETTFQRLDRRTDPARDNHRTVRVQLLFQLAPRPAATEGQQSWHAQRGR